MHVRCFAFVRSYPPSPAAGGGCCCHIRDLLYSPLKLTVCLLTSLTISSPFVWRALLCTAHLLPPSPPPVPPAPLDHYASKSAYAAGFVWIVDWTSAIGFLSLPVPVPVSVPKPVSVSVSLLCVGDVDVAGYTLSSLMPPPPPLHSLICICFRSVPPV